MFADDTTVHACHKQTEPLVSTTVLMNFSPRLI